MYAQLHTLLYIKYLTILLARVLPTSQIDLWRQTLMIVSFISQRAATFCSGKYKNICVYHRFMTYFIVKVSRRRLHNITESNIGLFYFCQSNLGRQSGLLDPWFCMFYLCQATMVFGWGLRDATSLRSRVSWQYLESFLVPEHLFMYTEPLLEK